LSNWSVYFLENNRNYCHQISSFKAKMHQIRFLLGLRHRPRWGSSQLSLRPPSCISGVLLLRKRMEREENRGRKKRRKTRGTKKGKKKRLKKTRSPIYISGYAIEKKEGEGQQKGRKQKGRKKLMRERERGERQSWEEGGLLALRGNGRPRMPYVQAISCYW